MTYGALCLVCKGGGRGGGGVRLREQEKLDVDCAVQLGAMAMGNCSLKAMQSIKLHVFCIAV